MSSGTVTERHRLDLRPLAGALRAAHAHRRGGHAVGTDRPPAVGARDARLTSRVAVTGLHRGDQSRGQRRTRHDRLLRRSLGPARALAGDHHRIRRFEVVGHRGRAVAVLADGERWTARSPRRRAPATPGRRSPLSSVGIPCTRSTPPCSAFSATARLPLACGTRVLSTWPPTVLASVVAGGELGDRVEAAGAAEDSAEQHDRGGHPGHARAHARERAVQARRSARAGGGQRRAGAPLRRASARRRSPRPSARLLRLAGGRTGSTERGRAFTAERSRSTSSWQTGHSCRWLSNARSLGLVERAEQVGAHVLLLGMVALDAHAATPARLLRSLSRPSRIRPLTVPMGISSMSAIWLWLKPPK